MMLDRKLTVQKLANKLMALYFHNAPFKAFHLGIGFRYKTGRWMNIKHPQKYDDKIQWIKLNYQTELITRCNDKVLVRGYIEEKGYGHLLNEVLNIYESVEDIDLDALPDAFAMRANHGSSWNIICHDKNKMDWQKELAKMDLWINSNFCTVNYEWGYKDIIPKIICEKYLGDSQGNTPNDYKFFCFDGEPRVIAVDYDRFTNHKRNIYDSEWNFLNCRINFMNDEDHKIEKPVNFDEMLKIARDLSADFPHVRVDLYEVEGKVYFSELTFYNGSGMSQLLPESFERQMGDWITII